MAVGATAWLLAGTAGAVAGDAGEVRSASAADGAARAAPDTRAMDVRRAVRRTAPPPGWACTPGLCRPRRADPIRGAAAFGIVLAGAGWVARRRATPGR